MHSNLKRYFIIFLLFALLFSCAHDNSKSDLRIVSLSPSHTEILFSLGLQDQIVGWTRYCNYPPEIVQFPGWVRYDKYEFKSIEDELSKKVAVVGGFMDVNMALIDSLKPDLILTSHNMQLDISKNLTATGYNVMHFTPVMLEDVFKMIE